MKLNIVKIQTCPILRHKSPKYINGEPKNQGEVHFLVGSEPKHEKESEN